MKPFQNTALLRPLTIEELRLEDPEWADDHTITFYIPCWFHVDSVFAGIHVETDQNDDYINLYCIYDTRVQSVRLQVFELEVEIDETTSKLLLNQAVEWLQAEKAY